MIRISVKYVFIGLAVAAAVAALVFHPPQHDAGPAVPPAGAMVRPVERHVVSPLNPTRVVVYVAGEVRKPGVYVFAAGRRAQDALERAGGPQTDADLIAVNLAALLHDGDEIAVPKIGAERPRSRRLSPRGRASRPHQRHARSPRSSATAPPAQPLDLNAATADELTLLPGIGPALAGRIVAYRQSNGPFREIDELSDVAGITPHLLDSLTPLVTIRSSV